MAETITEMIIPGTYIEVRSEGLIGVAGVATGNVGVVGTAAKGPVDDVVAEPVPLRIAPGRICRRRSHPHSPVNARATTVARTMLGRIRQRGQPVCGSRDAMCSAFW